MCSTQNNVNEEYLSTCGLFNEDSEKLSEHYWQLILFVMLHCSKIGEQKK